ncbi:MAG: methyltransferase [Aphanocapsa feldmannii 277cV]|uniref:Methyltransferase n=2 Tax=Aphanocapsa feldmannii TaxID=192050 RepID=A0A524RNI4_9CHRO|nr:MAG: methyltransferase [Aphanocapsa feldmannii 277cV]TGH27287.1 MAG: methyltransferase [Aphanocapsa feldmannii 277cI]
MERQAPPQPDDRARHFLQVTALIPLGRLSTYGRVAELAGCFGAARQVGWALGRLDPADTSIPWHRVVNARGQISMALSREGSDWLQRQLLLDEGIPVDEQGELPLARYLWNPDPDEIAEALWPADAPA